MEWISLIVLCLTLGVVASLVGLPLWLSAPVGAVGGAGNAIAWNFARRRSSR